MTTTANRQPPKPTHDPLDGYHDLSGLSDEKLNDAHFHARLTDNVALVAHLRREMTRRQADHPRMPTDAELAAMDDADLAALANEALDVHSALPSDLYYDHIRPLQARRQQQREEEKRAAQQARQWLEDGPRQVQLATAFLTEFGPDLAKGDRRRLDALLRFVGLAGDDPDNWADLTLFLDPPFRQTETGEMIYREGHRWRPGHPTRSATLLAFIRAWVTKAPPVVVASLPARYNAAWFKATLQAMEQGEATLTKRLYPDGFAQHGAPDDWGLMCVTSKDNYRFEDYETGESRWWATHDRIAAWARANGGAKCVQSLLPYLPPASLGDEDLVGYLNTPDGCLDLRTLQVVDPPDGKLPRRSTNVSPDFNGDSKARNLLADSLRDWQPDAEMRAYLQQEAAYLLTGKADRKEGFIHKGPKDSGKSSFNDGLCVAAGDYGLPLDANALLRAKAAGRDWTDLQGVRVVTMTEFSSKYTLDGATFRNLTGCDRLPIKRDGHIIGSYRPQFTLVLGTNQVPNIDDDESGATRRRVRLVEFAHTIPEENQDDRLHRLQEPDMQAAWLGWALEAAPAVMRGEWFTPEAVRDATDEVMDGMQPYAAALNRLQPSDDPVAFGDLYNDIAARCRKAKHPVPGKTKLSKDLKLAGFPPCEAWTDGRKVTYVYARLG